MSRPFILAAAAVAITAASPSAPRSQDVGWLAGHWVTEAEGRWTEESWTPPRGGVMLGTGLSGKGEAATSFEFMRIASRGGKLVFWGAPQGKPAVPFELTELRKDFAAFENRAHDYPTRITYRREGGMLIATTEGSGGSNLQIWRYRKRR